MGEEVKTDVGSAEERNKAAGCRQQVRYRATLYCFNKKKSKPHTLVAGRFSKRTCSKGVMCTDWSKMRDKLYVLYDGTWHKSTIGSLKPVSQRPVPLPPAERRCQRSVTSSIYVH